MVKVTVSLRRSCNVGYVLCPGIREIVDNRRPNFVNRKQNRIMIIIYLCYELTLFKLTTKFPSKMFHGFCCTEIASQNSSPESASMVAMLKVPGITLISLSLMGVAATWIILDPILEPHLEEQVTLYFMS